MQHVRSKPARPLILAMHGIEYLPVRDDPQRLFIAPSRLRSLIEYLKARGYTFATFGDLARALHQPDAARTACLTFDDGYQNNLYELVPILQSTGAVATVFVVSGWLGESHRDVPRRPMLSRKEVEILHGEGVEIGSHTATHRDLTTLARDEVRYEFETSKKELEDIVSAPVEVAAYPYGSSSPGVAAACKEVGFVAACGTSGRGSWADPFDLPRQDVGNRATTLGLELKRRDLYEPLMRSIPGRAARRLWYSAQKAL